MEQEQIKVLKKYKINDKLSVEHYIFNDQEYVGLNHFNFENKIVFKKSTIKKLSKTLIKLIGK